MSRLFIGNLDGVGPAVKIMANDTDDPRTTPNTDWWKFRFNSETAEIGYVNEVYTTSFAAAAHATSGPWSYSPAGTNDYTCNYRWLKRTLGGLFRFMVGVNFANMFTGSEDFISWVGADATDWMRLYAGVRRYYFTGGGADYLYCFGKLENLDRPAGATINVIPRHGTLESTVGDRYTGLVEWDKSGTGPGSVTNTFLPIVTDALYSDPNGSLSFTLYQTDLPIDDSPYPAVVGTPAPNLKIVRIDQANATIAKPGFHVDTATDDQLIIGHDKPPLLVARTGSFTLAPGAQQNVDVGLPITTKSLVDYQVNQTGHDLFLPAYPDNDASELNIQYRIVGQQVQFKNPSASVSFDVRFFVMAADELGATTGSAKVLNTDGGYIQLLRPGSSADPNSRDILLDSRAAYLPIIAQDYVPVADFSASGSYLGNRVYRVNLPAGNYKPFVLARSKNAVLNSNGNPTGEYFYADFYGKQLSVYDYMSNSSFLAHVADTYIDFYANVGRPEDVWRYEIGYASSVRYSQFLGVRYYIFAVPNSL